ncbi:hypothetical protein U9M48_031983 [Paspalum notatum var. saurae]|uniref:BHLH domain-containing protein n=1 Tax=Paspalum notatum var. saurae TaxID=547442 RepID=A0AAQ3U3R1_PASNO
MYPQAAVAANASPKRSKAAADGGGGTSKDDEDTDAAAEEEKPKPEPEPAKGYIHVRARRGQATDSHSLAERVRRERISERMKMLQSLVPGCNKVLYVRVLCVNAVEQQFPATCSYFNLLSLRRSVQTHTIITFDPYLRLSVVKMPFAIIPQ